MCLSFYLVVNFYNIKITAINSGAFFLMSHVVCWKKILFEDIQFQSMIRENSFIFVGLAIINFM